MDTFWTKNVQILDCQFWWLRSYATFVISIYFIEIFLILNHSTLTYSLSKNQTIFPVFWKRSQLMKNVICTIIDTWILSYLSLEKANAMHLHVHVYTYTTKTLSVVVWLYFHHHQIILKGLNDVCVVCNSYYYHWKSSILEIEQILWNVHCIRP